MTADSDPALSQKTLADLFAGALHVGVRTPPPEPPEWFAATDFPLVVENFVGRGGSGFVWKASRRDGHGAVALKLVPFRSDPLRLRERWENECAALAKLDHPNLIRLVKHGLAPDGEAGWLAMEWIEGRGLDEILSEQLRLPFAEVAQFLSQIGAALTALHDAGLVHRDVKPGNILRDETNARWVLADLGIALDLEKIEDHRVTRTMERPATPGYSPPEIELPSHVSAPSGDQFSLAFTAWEMLAGHRPQGAFPRLHKVSKCPVGIDGVLRRALATDPTARFPDIVAFLQAFHAAAKRPPWIVPAIGFFTLLLASILLWLALRPESFPKRFQSGKIHVNEGRQHFIHIDMTIEENGNFLAKIRTTSLNPLFGFDGRTEMLFRDKKGSILHNLSTGGHGVNGRLIPGGKHDRSDDWNASIPPDVARQVATIDFQAFPNSGPMDHRIRMNQGAIRRDIEEVKTGISQGVNALYQLLNPPPKKPPEE